MLSSSLPSAFDALLSPKHDRFISAAALKARVVFSLQHITRLEHAGQFPRRRHLGPARIAWSECEVTAWMQNKIDDRGPCPLWPHKAAVLGPNDRFLSKPEVSRLVLYSARHIQLLENSGSFPKRIRIGESRVAWLEGEILQWMSERP